jgi:formamidopyrimidine-DNA glycosylase
LLGAEFATVFRMAEVPEVETLTRDLREAVVGRAIHSAVVLQDAAVRFPAVHEFSALLKDRAITGAQRRAKYILLPLSDDLTLAVHLKLWGTLALVPTAQSRAPETLIVWHLDQNEDLRLLDKLGYARAAVAPPAMLAERLDLDSLGPDALDPSFNVEVLARQIGRRRGVLKTVLLNQRALAGLGNRDADESLWLAGIDPRRPASSLAQDELARLHAAIGKVLSEGIALRGTQRDLFGRKGQAQHRRYVFERTGLPCPRCNAPVAHLRIGGRNTHYCPQCQR